MFERIYSFTKQQRKETKSCRMNEKKKKNNHLGCLEIMQLERDSFHSDIPNFKRKKKKKIESSIFNLSNNHIYRKTHEFLLFF